MGSETRFSWNFQVSITVAGFLPFSPAFLIESCSFCHSLKDIFPLPKLDGSMQAVQVEKVQVNHLQVESSLK